MDGIVSGGTDTTGETGQTVALEAVRYDAQTGLVPVVVQDVVTNAVLMVAYANREALKRTLGSGDAWFWSRSRGEFWRKGSTSGHTQRVVDMRLDCDSDTVLYRVQAAGPACHTGATSCFYREVLPGNHGVPVEATGLSVRAITPAREAVDEATNGSGSGTDATQGATDGSAIPMVLQVGVLQQVWDTIGERFSERPQGSYTSYLFEQGIDKIAKKVGEEATEIVIAAKNTVIDARHRPDLAAESADFLYHWLVLCKSVGMTPNDTLQELARRM